MFNLLACNHDGMLVGIVRHWFFGLRRHGHQAAAKESNNATGDSNNMLRRAALCPRAKRVIFMFMAGAPSHVDTFD